MIAAPAATRNPAPPLTVPMIDRVRRGWQIRGAQQE